MERVARADQRHGVSCEGDLAQRDTVTRPRRLLATLCTIPVHVLLTLAVGICHYQIAIV